MRFEAELIHNSLFSSWRRLPGAAFGLSRAHYGTKGGFCTGHDDHFFKNTKPL
jgi:hypothetical protein